MYAFLDKHPGDGRRTIGFSYEHIPSGWGESGSSQTMYWICLWKWLICISTALIEHDGINLWGYKDWSYPQEKRRFLRHWWRFGDSSKWR